MPRHICPVCKDFGSDKLTSVFWHIKKNHCAEPYKITCGIDGCPKAYTTADGLWTHYRRVHMSMHNTTPLDTGQEEELYSPGTNNAYTYYVQSFFFYSSYVLILTPTPLHLKLDDYQQGAPSEDPIPTVGEAEGPNRAAALFILKTREDKYLPQSTMDELIKDVEELVSMTIEDERNKTKMAVIQSNIDLDSAPILTAHLESETPKLFKGLDTQYLQTKYFKEKLKLVVRRLTYVCICML
jgi:hypothetical protein